VLIAPFTPAERYAVFTVHGEKCYLCHKPINLRTMEVDHLIPESLKDDPVRLAAVLVALGRQLNFNLNTYDNWLPACGRCNNEKRNNIFEPSPTH
jgi:5-methylcytosine-specific restriction endonuclease McrA